jgi:hypothetical protein
MTQPEELDAGVLELYSGPEILFIELKSGKVSPPLVPAVVPKELPPPLVP